MDIADSLRLSKSVILRVRAHHRLHLSLIVVADLRVRLSVLVPEAIYGALTRSFLPLCVLSAFSLGLLRRNFYCVRSTVRFLLRFLLFICSAQVLADHCRILVQRRVGSHGHAIACFARRQFPIVVRLVVDVPECGVRLPRLSLIRILNEHFLAHLR